MSVPLKPPLTIIYRELPMYIYITSYGQNIVYWVMDGAILLGIVNG